MAETRLPLTLKPLAPMVIKYENVVNENGKIAVWVKRSVLQSDAQIIAVFVHEAHEFARFLEQLKERGDDGVSVREAVQMVTVVPNGPSGYFHDEAWEVSDGLVRMYKLRLRDPAEFERAVAEASAVLKRREAQAQPFQTSRKSSRTKK